MPVSRRRSWPGSRVPRPCRACVTCMRSCACTQGGGRACRGCVPCSSDPLGLPRWCPGDCVHRCPVCGPVVSRLWPRWCPRLVAPNLLINRSVVVWVERSYRQTNTQLCLPNTHIDPSQTVVAIETTWQARPNWQSIELTHVPSHNHTNEARALPPLLVAVGVRSATRMCLQE